MARDRHGGEGVAIHAIVMLNGSILQDVASPTRAQKMLASPAGPAFARAMGERGFKSGFSRIFSDAHPLSDDEAADQWSLIAHKDGKLVLPKTIAYMDERRRLADRWHGAFGAWEGDLQLVWGMQDPVANPAVLRGLQELRPGVPTRELDDVGHYPQLEDPLAVAQALTRTA
jgi:pimeloyl-ACP methyl ester carboxylesterase